VRRVTESLIHRHDIAVAPALGIDRAEFERGDEELKAGLFLFQLQEDGRIELVELVIGCVSCLV
jgi:hypothetical protein